ncbi:chloramphenicol O-acetyltransferase type A [Dysgonomonas sp. PFB1-18]|uniref:chloramphenicol acetyltransferase n=1 Tax=unclassified Dysgonomonas TaxID=2630389 RepID=UPI0024772A20|nr:MULTISPECIES: chloramphenicol acetyltransferase [unclassified Dysgonomonas]MDL2303198.1 chloramphenicol acetyltransferase [Dysgonomonas sp. OttesenSCG-928-D17]MDH6310251.1 chloramphenicol O-acetyltransferase type A [Dysgonomonas sp. PF1-14]MDH6340069.1 chloramphenicol O-acetyltransferase type A [Dysgonomonas sp. PF1-16]MDH6381824.1 chloramphenicol O-acetyltransferase type A [Dysgonomonas sp. PFB1-18]MDH6398934.1 chloramphenicol O-acetyltransferase type A [Dysgonomonas sp. PF1-23]
MNKIIDINTWIRKEHYEFFKDFDDPMFGLTFNVDFTAVYNEAKRTNSSFFLFSLHKIMQAANATEEFRYRIEGDDVVCYDVIHASSTVGRPDGTFGFSTMEYFTDRDTFVSEGSKVVERIKSLTGITFEEQTDRKDVIHYSPMPWIQFTDLKHPASFGKKFSIPKISTGKLFKEGAALKLPVSVTANHALMDGYHVARFLDNLNDLIQAD